MPLAGREGRGGPPAIPDLFVVNAVYLPSASWSLLCPGPSAFGWGCLCVAAQAVELPFHRPPHYGSGRRRLSGQTLVLAVFFETVFE